MPSKKTVKPIPNGSGARTGLRFEKILVNAEKSLRLELEAARLESDHNLSRGEQAEAAVRDTLRRLLPSGYSVGSGHVYDAYGDQSKQTDVVIANPDHPLSFPEGRAGTYLVDGVGAAGEVKAVLTGSRLQDCIRKGTAFKRLRMTINPRDFVGVVGRTDLIKQMGFVPPFFVLAFESNASIELLHQKLQATDLIPPPDGKSDGPQDVGDAPQPPIDAVCVLGQGIFLYLRPDNELGLRAAKKIQPQDASPGNTIEFLDEIGWIFMPTDAPLAWLLTWLHASMPRVFRGSSVFSPYLIPNQKNLGYMAKQGKITIRDDRSEA